MIKEARDIIIRPIITENSMDLAQDKKYTFEVDKRANKVEIRKAIEEIFDVDVDKVNTMNIPGKTVRRGLTKGRRKNWKKAIVTLKPESKEIEFFTT